MLKKIGQTPLNKITGPTKAENTSAGINIQDTVEKVGAPLPIDELPWFEKIAHMSMKWRVSDDKKKAGIDAFMKTARPGDVLLCNNFMPSPMKHVQKVAFDSPWSHGVMYVGDGIFVDATSRRKVTQRSAEEFFSMYRFSIFRPQYKTEEARQKSLEFLNKHLGCEFNLKFTLGNEDKFYCTELVYHAITEGFKADGMSEEEIKAKLPLDNARGKDYITNMTFSHSPLLKKVEVPDEAGYFWSMTEKELKTPLYARILQRLFGRSGYIEEAKKQAALLAGGPVGLVSAKVAEEI